MVKEYENRLNNRLLSLSSVIPFNKETKGYYITKKLDIGFSFNCSISCNKFEHPSNGELIEYYALMVDGEHDVLWYLTKEKAIEELQLIKDEISLNKN